MNLLDLPNELLQKIVLSFDDFESYFNFSVVCKRIAFVVSDPLIQRGLQNKFLEENLCNGQCVRIKGLGYHGKLEYNGYPNHYSQQYYLGKKHGYGNTRSDLGDAEVIYKHDQIQTLVIREKMVIESETSTYRFADTNMRFKNGKPYEGRITIKNGIVPCAYVYDRGCVIKTEYYDLCKLHKYLRTETPVSYISNMPNQYNDKFLKICANYNLLASSKMLEAWAKNRYSFTNNNFDFVTNLKFKSKRPFKISLYLHNKYLHFESKKVRKYHKLKLKGLIIPLRSQIGLNVDEYNSDIECKYDGYNLPYDKRALLERVVCLCQGNEIYYYHPHNSIHIRYANVNENIVSLLQY